MICRRPEPIRTTLAVLLLASSWSSSAQAQNQVGTGEPARDDAKKDPTADPESSDSASGSATAKERAATQGTDQGGEAPAAGGGIEGDDAAPRTTGSEPEAAPDEGAAASGEDATAGSEGAASDEGAERVEEPEDPEAGSQVQGAASQVDESSALSEPRVRHAEETDQEHDQDEEQLVDRAIHIEAALAYRSSWVLSDAYEPFSKNDHLPGGDARLGASVWQSGSLSIATHLQYVLGFKGASTRGADFDLIAHRFLANVEARYEFVPRLLAYGRLAPGAGLVAAGVDGLSNVDLEEDSWVFAGDAALGIAYRFEGDAGQHWSPRFLLFAEGGGTFSTDAQLTLESGPEGPARPQPLELEGLPLSGPFFSLGMMFRY